MWKKTLEDGTSGYFFPESHHRAHLRLDGSLKIVCRRSRNTQIGRFTLVSRAGGENSNSNGPKIEKVRAIKAARWRNGVVSKPVRTGSITRVSPFKVGGKMGGRQICEGGTSLKATCVCSKPSQFSRMIENFTFYHDTLCTETIVTV